MEIRQSPNSRYYHHLRNKQAHLRVEQIRSHQGHIAEFAATIGLAILLLFPFLNLLTIATSYATICLLTQQCVNQAAKQHSYKEALKVIRQESEDWLKSPFASFAKLSSVGGYQNSGIDLFVEATDFRTTKVTTFGPNEPVPPPLDPQTFVYELAAQSSFEVKPFVDMSQIPVVCDIAGLGQPITLNYRCAKAAEHIAGLDDDSPITTAYSGGAMTFNAPKLQSEGPTTSQANVGSWNHPDMYEAIKNAGQKVLAQDVIIVHANNSYWTPTKLFVPEGAKLWVDYRADGVWQVRAKSYADDIFDADGYYTFNQQYDEVTDPQTGTITRSVIPEGSLIGKLGLNGKRFFMGKAAWNKELGKAGELFIGMNESSYDPETGLSCGLVNIGEKPSQAYYTDNVGQLEVRIVIAK